MTHSLRFHPVILCLVICLITIAAPSSSFGIVYEFSFTGSVSYTRPMNCCLPGGTCEFPEFYVGQTASGILYWDSEPMIAYDSFPTNPAAGVYYLPGPSYLAEIYVGDVLFNLRNNNYAGTLYIGNEVDADSLSYVRTASSIFYYRNRSYSIDIPSMHLVGNNNIFTDGSYPSYLDLSLFDSGHIEFQIANYADYSGEGALRINISQISSVPEPSTLLILGFGLVGLAGVRKKIRN